MENEKKNIYINNKYVRTLLRTHCTRLAALNDEKTYQGQTGGPMI